MLDSDFSKRNMHGSFASPIANGTKRSGIIGRVDERRAELVGGIGRWLGRRRRMRLVLQNDVPEFGVSCVSVP